VSSSEEEASGCVSSSEEASDCVSSSEEASDCVSSSEETGGRVSSSDEEAGGEEEKLEETAPGLQTGLADPAMARAVESGLRLPSRPVADIGRSNGAASSLCNVKKAARKQESTRRRASTMRAAKCTDSDSGVEDPEPSSRSSSCQRATPTDHVLSSPAVRPGDALVCCDLCGRQWVDGLCLLHGPPISVPDSPVPREAAPSCRAELSTPPQLRVGSSSIHGRGVFTRRPLQAGLRFGPYLGRVVLDRDEAARGGCSWEICRRDGRLAFCVDAADPAEGNWMRYVNCARSEAAQNLEAYQHRWRVFYRTVRTIAAAEELLVYYGDEYRSELTEEAAAAARDTATGARSCA